MAMYIAIVSTRVPSYNRGACLPCLLCAHSAPSSSGMRRRTMFEQILFTDLEGAAEMTDATPTDTLTARLIDDKSKRPRILTDCERLINEEVASKGGFSGLAIKAAYKVVCAVKPGVVRESMDTLLDDFVKRLEPFYAEHRAAGGEPKNFGDMMSKKPDAVADALLGITDDRAKRAKNETLKSAYGKLRPQAKKHVEDAVPRVGRTLAPHL